jgi:hypothetical protein
MGISVEFSEAPTPALEAGVWILELLAESLDRILTSHTPQLSVDCAERDMGLVDLPRILGGFAAQRLPYVGEDAEKNPIEKDREDALNRIWADFVGDGRIRKLPQRTRRLLESAAAETKRRIQGEAPNLSWLEGAHEKARKFIRDFLASRTTGKLPALQSAKVKIVEDPKNEMYCARTQSKRGEIAWAHQNVAHALTNMLLAERVLAHEYLSHLLPQNSSLGHAVTERWLIALLQTLYRNLSGEPYWPAVVWGALRQDLEKHVVGMETARNSMLEPVRTLGIFGLEAVATDLIGAAPTAYWRFTEELLTVPADKDVEAMFQKIMSHFASIGPDAVELILSANYVNIQALYDYLSLS